MKRIVWMALLAMALPLAAFADNSVDFSNHGGTLSGSASGFTLKGSELIDVSGFNGMGLIQGGLGTLSFSTGAMMAGGNLQTGASFLAGGSFDILSNGSQGLPKGILFQGTFTGPVTWTEVQLANGSYDYTLQGAISGTWYNGQTVYGATTQLTINTGKMPFDGKTRISSGDTNVMTSVPEPGTLGLLGTGLVGLAGILHRKLRA
ncbi:MAG: PEP-CTERM sorting domain-containing protein [Candidatus Sulfotelmatobacter sp.]|jgi:hypothetical protein